MSLEVTFNEIFGHEAHVRAEAPGRVNLIGEHIDYSEGFVLPFAIADRTFALVAKNGTEQTRIASMQRKNKVFTINVGDIAPGSAGDWEKYVLGVLWTLGISEGVDILVDGHVPGGAGLSSSAALECSVAVAINTLFGLNKTLEDLARATQKAENDYVGMPCGIMDQSVSLMGREGSALLLDCRDLSTESVPFNVASAGLELLIVDTQAHHALVDGGYAERRAACEKVAATFGIPSMRHLTLDILNARKNEISDVEFKRAHHAVTEIARVLDAVDALKKSEWAHLGELITQSHISLRDDYNVSCPELDVTVDASLAAGALGSRMVGGGFGGSAIALIKAESVVATQEAIKKAFADKGFKAPRFFTSLPSAGASAQLIK